MTPQELAVAAIKYARDKGALPPVQCGENRRPKTTHLKPTNPFTRKSVKVQLPMLTTRATCVHLGLPLRDQSCGCKEKLRECAVYGTCTTGVRRAGVKCCEGCDGYCSLDYYDTCRRHLIYYVLPVKGDVWRWNCDRIKSYLPLFNGRRVVAVGIKSPKYELDTVDEVAKYLGPTFDVIQVPQRKRLGEVLAFPDLAKRVRHLPGYTFYAHAKGVTRGGSTREWTDLMYRANLDDWDRVQESLRHYPVTGAFKMPWTADLWFYSGTFFWVRNEELRSVDIPQFYGGVEHWPCRKMSTAGCTFMEYAKPTNLYDPAIVDHAKELYMQRNDMYRVMHETIAKVKRVTAPEVSGCGVVTVASPDYYPSVYVMIKRLRALGCALPIHVYHIGPWDDRLADCIPHEVTITRHKWAYKSWAIKASGLQHVLYLDADVYPLKDPTPLLGATRFWGEGIPGIPHWRPSVFDLPPSKGPVPQGGTMVWDVSADYDILDLWDWYNSTADFWYPQTYSDQECLQAARLHLRTSPEVLTRVEMVDSNYVHGEDFVHRITHKFGKDPVPEHSPLPHHDLAMKEYREWQSMTR